MGRPRIPLAAKLERFELDDNGCWLWLGQVNKYGYGKVSHTPTPMAGLRHTSAHRASFEHHVGPIPDGMHLDHLCGNRACINPAHLEPVTPRENVMRSAGVCAENARKTICKNNHLLTEENTYRYTWKGNSWRGCRECRRDADRRRNAREKASA